MVGAVSAVSGFNAIAYLNKIQGVTPVEPAQPAPKETPSTNDSTSSNTTKTTSKTSLNSLLGLSSDVLSLLQGTDSSSSASSLISNLFGSSSVAATDPLEGLYNVLRAQVSSNNPVEAAVSGTQQQQAQQSTKTNDPVQSLLTSYNNTANAYNKTLLQNAQSVLKANSQSLVA